MIILTLILTCIYPEELEIKDTKDATKLAKYLDLRLKFEGVSDDLCWLL